MKIWQAIDKDGTGWTFVERKPELTHVKTWTNRCDSVFPGFLFPLHSHLKPLQIAEITVTAGGTWSYEIEREEGFYMANKKPDFGRGIVQYKGGKWFDIDGAPLAISLEPYTISKTRIPDECII